MNFQCRKLVMILFSSDLLSSLSNSWNFRNCGIFLISKSANRTVLGVLGVSGLEIAIFEVLGVSGLEMTFFEILGVSCSIFCDFLTSGVFKTIFEMSFSTLSGLKIFFKKPP